MIELVSLTNQRAAQALCDYLTLNHIQNQLQGKFGQYHVEVLHEADFGKAAELTREFLESPNQKKFLEASWLVDKHPSNHLIAKKSAFSMPALSQIKPLWVTYCVVFFSLIVFLGGKTGLATFFYPLLSFPTHIETIGLAELLKFITPAFLHFSVMHIVFNLLWWWQFGSQVEHYQGSLRLVCVFLVTALFSDLAQAFVTGPNFGGLSGVVYGLLGYLWIYKRFCPESCLIVQPQIITFMLVWLLIGYTGVLDSLFGSVANSAHAAGLLSGCLCGAIFAFFDKGIDQGG